MVWIAPDEKGDGRVGEATGEEGGERGGSVAVRAALGGAGVGGVGGAKGLADRRRGNKLVNETGKRAWFQTQTSGNRQPAIRALNTVTPQASLDRT